MLGIIGAFALQTSNRHAEAIPCYDKALQIDPKNVAGWCNRGISLSALGRDEEALQCFDKALKLDAKHSIVWQKKADSLRNLGHPPRGSLEMLRQGFRN